MTDGGQEKDGEACAAEEAPRPAGDAEGAPTVAPPSGTENAAAAEEEGPGGRKARIGELLAQKRQAMRSKLEARKLEEDHTTERWSGLRIADRCVRAEKWDASMRGKSVVPFYHLAALSAQGRDQVVIGVLHLPPATPKVSPGGERLAEWFITDLDATEARQVALLLVDAALDCWADPTGGGHRSATVGSILAVLNPTSCRNGRAIRIGNSTQLIKLGTCPSLAFCSAKGPEGLPCRSPYNSEGGSGFCARHARMSFGERQAETERRAQVPSRKRPLPLEPLLAARRPVALPGAGALPSRGGAAALRNVVARTAATVTSSAALGRSAGLGLPAQASRARAEEAGGATTGRSAALELPAQALASANSSAADLLQALQQLEAADVDREGLGQTELYQKVGLLVHRPDKVGMAATRLRRRWRALMDGAGAGLQSQPMAARVVAN